MLRAPLDGAIAGVAVFGAHDLVSVGSLTPLAFLGAFPGAFARLARHCALWLAAFGVAVACQTEPEPEKCPTCAPLQAMDDWWLALLTIAVSSIAALAITALLLRRRYSPRSAHASRWLLGPFERVLPRAAAARPRSTNERLRRMTRRVQ